MQLLHAVRFSFHDEPHADSRRFVWRARAALTSCA
jgi:hypothetical protein